MSRTRPRTDDTDRLGAEPLGFDGTAAICILLFTTLSPRNWLPDHSVGLIVARVLWGVIYVFVTGRVLQRFGTDWIGWVLRRQRALCVLLAVAGVSCLWSLDPVTSLISAVSLGGTTMIGLFVAFTCPPERFMRVLYWTFALSIVSSIVVAVLVPFQLRPGDPIGWRGIMVHKNVLGEAAVLGTIFFVVVTAKRCVHPAWGSFLCISSLVALAGSRSRTAYGALAIGLLAAGHLLMRRPNPTTWRRLVAVMLTAGSVLPFFVGPIAARLGSDDPLNARTLIWASALTIITQRPLTGYGFMALWGPRRAVILAESAVTTHRSALHAHNTTINIATQLGIPAAVVSCVYIYGAVSDALRRFERDSSAYSIVIVGLLLAIIVMGFTEAVLLLVHSFFWILVVAVSVGAKWSLDRPATRVAAQE